QPPPYSQPPIAPVYSQPPPPSFGPGYQGFGPIAITLRAYKPPRYTPKEGDQVVPFDQRRRLIAEHMVYSKATSPHVPCTAEVDMTNLTRLRGEWKRAKETGGKVRADELSGGSCTVCNPGLKGSLFGAAIINQPQVGILRMGEIVKRAVVRERDGEDAIVIRSMMYLTLSYDHRVIDGVTGNGFLHRVRELIEEAKFAL